MRFSFKKSRTDEHLYALGRKFNVGLSGDNFRKWVTAIVILISFSPSTFADFDLALGGLARSYPLGGGAEVNAGYGILLWGDAGPPWYGYTRLRLDGTSAATYNAASSSLEVYPVSFLGVRAGGEAIQNDAEYSAHDCVTRTCRGRFYNTFVQAELTLGVGSFFMQGRWRRERWSQSTSAPVEFVEPEAALALAGTGDSRTYYRGTLGMKLNDRWSVIGSMIYFQVDSNNGISRFPFGMFRYRTGEFSIAAGGGVFASQLKTEGPAALIIFNWEIWPSLALK